MNPNLDYAQMQRGPNGQTGSNTGVLYVVSGYLGWETDVLIVI